MSRSHFVGAAGETTGIHRGRVTQNRNFTYNGSDLMTAVNPENGTVNYTYDNSHHMTSRTDALGHPGQRRYTLHRRTSETITPTWKGPGVRTQAALGTVDSGDPARWNRYPNMQTLRRFNIVPKISLVLLRASSAEIDELDSLRCYLSPSSSHVRLQTRFPFTPTAFAMSPKPHRLARATPRLGRQGETT
jgi:YD repeat-containing protein